MASRKFFSSRPNHIHPSSDNPITSSDSQFEFEESEVWDNSLVGPTQTESSKKAANNDNKYSRSSSRRVPATGKRAERDAPAAGSLPVTVPDWSRILKDEYRDSRFGGGGEEGDVDDGGADVDDRVPPHVYLARRRGASMSVHEGFGRTLKGSDLRRVRNAIWKRVGFED